MLTRSRPKFDSDIFVEHRYICSTYGYIWQKWPTWRTCHIMSRWPAGSNRRRRPRGVASARQRGLKGTPIGPNQDPARGPDRFRRRLVVTWRARACGIRVPPSGARAAAPSSWRPPACESRCPGGLVFGDRNARKPRARRTGAGRAVDQRFQPRSESEPSYCGAGFQRFQHDGDRRARRRFRPGPLSNLKA